MRKAILPGFFLVFFSNTNAQTVDGFVKDVKQNIYSYKALSPVLEKHKKYETKWRQPRTNFFGCRSYFHYYVFDKPHKDPDHPVYGVPVEVYYKDDKIVYASIVIRGEWDKFLHKNLLDDTLFRYIDHQFSDSVLGEYNKIHNVEFTWHDLFEERIDNFTTEPGLGFWKDGEPRTEWERVYLPMVKRKDHFAIQNECKSFNPVRRVYGAFALFHLKDAGECLNDLENKMFLEISASKDKVHYSWGCLGYPDKPIDEVLKSEIESYLKFKQRNNID